MHVRFTFLAVATLMLSACATDTAHPPPMQRAATANAPNMTSTLTSGMPLVDTAAAQRLLSPDETLQTLGFPESGTKTLSGRIEGYKSVSYELPIRKGQRLEVTMDTKSTSAYFNIQDVKDASGAALFAGELSGTTTALIRATADTT
jgi:hypothetical protein